ncbi:MAG: cysteine dioxygenase family protein [Planctomycetota bacterium]
MNLTEFFDALDQHDHSVPIDELVVLMQSLTLDRAEVCDHVKFCDEKYGRNLIRLGKGYAALVLCWQDGQKSPIHDHRGSACGVKVLDGVASETQYEVGADGMLHETVTHRYPTGHVCGSYDADIHVMYNDQGDGCELVTLHVYTPPLSTIHMYTLDSAEVGTWTDHETQAMLSDMARTQS